jgi:hypothetical protein
MRGLAMFAFLGALAVGGCATDVGPTEAELKATWEAQNVYPESYRRDLLAYLRTYLNDPTQVRDAAVTQPRRVKVGEGDRFVSCVRFKARKSDKQYAASKDGAASFVSGKLDRFYDEPKQVHELCKDTVFVPFPELENLTR